MSRDNPNSIPARFLDHARIELHSLESLKRLSESRCQHSLVTHAIKTTEASDRSRMNSADLIPRKRESDHFASSSNTSA